MSKHRDAQQLHNLVAGVIGRRAAAVRLKPAMVAQEVMSKLDMEQVSHPLVWLGCHLEVRQIARGMLATHFDPITKPDEDEPVLPFTNLQWRYPERPKPGEEPSYILRDLMTDEDVAWNVARLQAEGRAKLAHADALKAWNDGRHPA